MYIDKNYKDYICLSPIPIIMKHFILIFSVVFFTELVALAQPGTLDLTLDSDGIVLVNPANQFDNAQDVIVLPDNKILLCGTTGSSMDFDMMVVQLNEDGSYDTGFGNNGVFTLSNTLGSDYAYDMNLLPNGNIIIVGAKSLSAADTQFAAWVIKPDGTLDFAFSGDGVYEYNNDGGEEYLYKAIVQDNDIYLVGVQYTPGFSYNKIAVQKLDLQGNLVTSFGNGGTANFSLSNADQFTVTSGTYLTEGALAISGDMYNESTFSSSPMLVLLNLNGSPVNAFGNNGIWQGSSNGTYYDVEYSNSKLIAVGTNGFASTVSRHNLDGSLDASFATNGVLINGVGGYSCYYDLILGADDKWYACGTTSSGFMIRDFLTSRISLEGALDATWASTGNVVTSLGESFDDAYGIGIQQDGKVVCAGLTAQDLNDMGVVRYLGDNSVVFISGCTSSDACNYNPTANVNDGSCYFIGDPCDDGLASTINDTYNASCNCEGIVGVEEIQTNAFSIYPNPSASLITLTAPTTGYGSIRIVDLTGRVVKQKNMFFNSTQEINIAELPNGIYSVVVTLEAKQSVVTLVKI